MELKIRELAIPARVEWNYEELKAELTKATADYKGLVYTAETIGDAKKDKAKLNALKKALNDARIRKEREYMEPFTAFKAQVGELVKLIDEPLAAIDGQVKAYEEQRRQEKAAAIKALISGKNFPDGYNLKPVINPRWLNVTYKESQISAELDAALERITAETEILSGLPAFSFEALDVYKQTLDMSAAMGEARRLKDMKDRKEAAEKARAEAEARRKAEAEEKARKEAEKIQVMPLGGQPFTAGGETAAIIGQTFREEFPEAPEVVQAPAPEPAAAQWVRFEALMTTPQAYALKKFFDDNGIHFRPC